MHACGHDVHITALVGTARQMIARRGNWSGTLVLIAQPAEETISGARAMIEDGLYTPLSQARLCARLPRRRRGAGGPDRGAADDRRFQRRIR